MSKNPPITHRKPTKITPALIDAIIYRIDELEEMRRATANCVAIDKMKSERRIDALEARVKALEEWMPKDRLALAALAEPFTTSRTQPLTKFSKIRRKKA